MDGLIAKAPELAALLSVVFMFLKHMMTIQKEHTKAMNARDEFIRILHEDHMRARSETKVALEQNAIATFQNTHALNELRDTFRHSENASYSPDPNTHQGSQ